MDLITLATFSTIYEAKPYQVNLEREGVYCFLKDEHTVTIAPIYDNAVGGIKLQVQKRDYNRAKQIMQDAGYRFSDASDLPAFWKWFDKSTKNIPLLRRLVIVHRFVAFLIIILAIILIPIYFYSIPTTLERLTKGSWCIDYIDHKNEQYKPGSYKPIRSMEVVKTHNNNCDAEMQFYKGGLIILPGFNSESFSGQWKLDDDKIIISRVDTFNYVYEGSYEVTFEEHHLELTSENTTIYCYLIPTKRFRLPF